VTVVQAEVLRAGPWQPGASRFNGVAKAGLRIRLETPADMTFSNLDLDALTFFIRGTEDFPMQIYEHIFAHGMNVLVQPTEKPFAWQTCPACCDHQPGWIYR
jgi:type VI protein secretion system component VasA